MKGGNLGRNQTERHNKRKLKRKENVRTMRRTINRPTHDGVTLDEDFRKYE
jgi:hypothetical protein